MSHPNSPVFACGRSVGTGWGRARCTAALGSADGALHQLLRSLNRSVPPGRRGAADPQKFGYTLAATVEGAAYSARVVDGRNVRLSITPSRSYTIWFTASTRLNAPSHDSVAEAKRALASAKSRGYSATLGDFRSWWHDFWGKSFVQYSGLSGDADCLENIYYLSTYMIAAGGYGTNPFHFINGVFRATRDQTKWSNAYWFWNQRDVYNSFLASDHVDLLAGFNRLYSRNATALKAYTRTRYDVDGLWVPETMGWDGNARGTVNSDFTDNIWSTGTEAAYNNSQLTYDSNWHATSGRGYGDYNDDTHHSTTVNAVAQYTFTGTGIAYISERNGDMGPVDVHLDGAFQATVDLRVSGARQVQQTVWQRSGLTQGTHTIRIVNRSTSVGMVDALRITP